MTIAFYLHSKKDKRGKHWIFCRYSHEGKRYRFSAGIKIAPTDWSNRKQRPKPSYQYADEVNRVLERIESDLKKTAYDLLAERMRPTPDRVRKKLNDKGQKFWDVWKAFESSKYPTISHSTRNSFIQAKKALLRFEKDNGEFEVSDMSQGFCDSFRGYLIQAGNTPSTAGIRAASLRTFAIYCHNEGLIGPVNWTIPQAKSTKPKVYLTLEELEQIERMEVSGDLQDAKEIFLFLSHTGLRYSDGQKVRATDIENGRLRFITTKTAKEQSIMLSPLALSILERKGTLPNVNEYKFYREVKKLCQLAGINQKVRGKEKWEYVSAHVARYTFATLMLEAGIDQFTVQKMLGHSSARTTATYDHRGQVSMDKAIQDLFGRSLSGQVPNN